MWQTPVYDRTAADVAAGAEKCYINAATLNRIESNTEHLAKLLDVEVDTKTWTPTDMLTRSQAQRILDNVTAVRNAYHVLPGTPDLPTAPSTLYTDINAIEHVQWSIRELFIRNSQRAYTGELYAGQSQGVI